MSGNNIISKMLCKQCRNKLVQVVKDDILYKKCTICNTFTKSDRSEYIIKSTIYAASERDIVINKSIRDDPCLPLKEIFCPTCNKIQLSKYIRNDETLKISHVICLKCNEIRKYEF